MKLRFSASLAALLLSFQLFAHAPREGMWIPFLISGNISEMQEMGLRLSAEDIYSANRSSLKDAIVKFGGGCTGSVISSQGLLLTNHHCGFGSLQRHSSVENDLLRNGFWAASLEDELPNRGLSVTFIVSMRDVTSEVIGEGLDEMSMVERARYIQERSRELMKAATGTDPFLKAELASFYYGNQYILILKRQFKDIRLVGAPPGSIGKFGGDTDNWIWPRHTGDFSLFRIYANADNGPAGYDEKNRPFRPGKYLEIDRDGVHPGDFTMVYGFPARTSEYLVSQAVSYQVEQNLPARVRLRTLRLDVINAWMKSDDKIRIQYASKQSGISNGWKKWQGMIRGLRVTDAVKRKKEFEARFAKEAGRDDRRPWHDLLKGFEENYSAFLPYDLARTYLTEAGLGLELVSFAMRFRNLAELSELDGIEDMKLRAECDKLMKQSARFFKDYQAAVDREIFPKLLKAYSEELDPEYQPQVLKDIRRRYHGDFEAYSDYVFKKSFLADQEKVQRFLKNYKARDLKKLKKDPAFRLMQGLLDSYFEDIQPQWQRYSSRIDSLYRLYVRAQMEIFPEREYYPDANFTLRISYGKVEGFYPADAIYNQYQTTGRGILEKAFTGLDDYLIDERMQKLLEEKDFGPYGENGRLPVAFIASNHTSGGNSGSPVLNGEGQLCGLNFDRNWEGTMSDIHYDPDLCRNISVDIRYILFIIDKYAGAERLIRELDE